MLRIFKDLRHPLWVAAIFFTLALWCLPRTQAVKVIESQWTAFKESLLNEWRAQDFRPESRIQILQIPMRNRLEFWLNKDLKIELSRALQKFSGVVLPIFDPVLFEKDSELSVLLNSPQLIHPLSLRSGVPANLEVERKIAKSLIQPPASQFARPVIVEPSSKAYFENSAHLYGITDYSIDQESRAAQFVVNFPLVIQGAVDFLPTAATTAYLALSSCGQPSVESSKKMICDEKQKRISLPSPLPLHFYASRFSIAKRISEIDFSKKLLIVEIVDQTTKISARGDDFITPGVLMATAVSNLLASHFPWRTEFLRGSEFAFFALCLAGLLWGFSLSNAMAWTMAVSALGAFILGDLGLCLTTNADTSPVEGFLGLFIFAVVGLTRRTRLDAEQRNLIERALSGYVSETRLRRLLNGKEKLELSGRIRSMSLLLLDLEKFSAASKEWGAVKTFEVLRKFFRLIDPVIMKHNGSIDKITGDGLLAFFGDTETEDRPTEAAQAATAAAIEIQEVLRREQFPLRCRIGVNSGEVMIGNAGSEKHFNYTVLGPAVNFTQRLEAACPPGEILLGEETEKLLQMKNEKAVDLKSLTIDVKNEKSAQAFRVLRSEIKSGS